VAAEVEWTFPLDFVEIVWGDGVKTDRQIISTTDLPPFGKSVSKFRSAPSAKNGFGLRRGIRQETALWFSR
jgi:hypothetical protein